MKQLSLILSGAALFIVAALVSTLTAQDPWVVTIPETPVEQVTVATVAKTTARPYLIEIHVEGEGRNGTTQVGRIVAHLTDGTSEEFTGSEYDEVKASFQAGFSAWMVGKIDARRNPAP